MTARHAATDGSFGRSAGGAAARGAGLLLVAVVLGILLLRSGGGDPYSRAVRTTSPGVAPITAPLPTATTVTVALRPPADVKVIPANGTSTAGAGTAAGDRLKSSGYNVLAPTNTTKPATTSNVFFAVGYDREARAVAQLVGLPDSSVQPMPSPPPVADAKDANLILVVGPDFPKLAPAASSTPTTARRSTATTARSTATTRASTVTTRASTATTRASSSTTR